MSEEAINKILRRIRKETKRDLDQGSYCVYEATGKAAEDWDFLCNDYSGYRYVRVFLDTIPKEIYTKLLKYNYSPQLSTQITTIQFYVWPKYGQSPIARPKLRFNCPEQMIPAILTKLVK